MNISECKVIQDLLPIYLEGMCSEESNKLVEEHLDGCSECKNIKQKLEKEVFVGKSVVEKYKEGEDIFIKKISKKLEKNQKYAVLRGIGLSLIIVIIVGLIYFMTCKLRIEKVSNEEIEVNRFILNESDLIFQLSVMDGYAGGMIDIEEDIENKTCYITIKRTLIKKRNIYDSNDVYFYSVNLEQINKVYLGSPQNSKLLWQVGDDVDKISADELDELYQKSNEKYYKETDRYYEQ